MQADVQSLWQKHMTVSVSHQRTDEQQRQLDASTTARAINDTSHLTGQKLHHASAAAESCTKTGHLVLSLAPTA
jgi:hypothetical protein